MNGDSACFSKGNDEWETPQWLYDQVNKEFDFQVDAAANDLNKKCERYFPNALTIPWYMRSRQQERFWLNMPYSLTKEFIQKSYIESRRGALVVCLIANRSSNDWYHEYLIDKAAEVRIIEGRVSFKGRIKVKGQPKDLPKDQIQYELGSASAPFPSILVVYRPEFTGSTKWTSWKLADQNRPGRIAHA